MLVYQRMAEERLPKRALKWMPKQKTARLKTEEKLDGRNKEGHERKKPNDGQWEDRKQWSVGVG